MVIDAIGENREKIGGENRTPIFLRENRTPIFLIKRQSVLLYDYLLSIASHLDG
jgi:hypothetical protein